MFFHGPQGQLDGLHFFICDLKSRSDTNYLISCGAKLQTFSPKWHTVSASHFKAISITEVISDSSLCKILLRIAGDILLDTLYISIVRACKILSWIELELSFCNSSSIFFT